jgi:small conductance mechanosensitive channel
MEHVWTELQQVFGPRAIGEFFADALPDLLIASITLAVFYFVWRVLRKVVVSVSHRAKIDTTAATFIQSVIKVVLFTIALVTGLGQLGIDTSSLLTSLGVAGLTIGFAAKDALSNVISGLFIFWDRPFVIGDLVEVDGRYGRVETITMRSTRVVTPDGKMLAIPNSTVVNGTVASYTNFPHLRLDIAVTINPAENIQRVREIILGALADDEALMSEPAPTVVVKALNDFNVEVELSAWIHDETEHVRHRTRLREAVFEALLEAGVDMPYETFRIEPVEVRLPQPDSHPKRPANRLQ